MAADLATIGPFAGWQAGQDSNQQESASQLANGLALMQARHAESGASQERATAQKSLAEARLKNLNADQLQLMMNLSKERQAQRLKAAQTQPGQQSLEQQAAGQPAPGSVPQDLFQEGFAEVKDLQSSGMYDKASLVLQRLAAGQASAARINRDQQATIKTKIESQLLEANFLSSVLGSVKTPQDWQQSLMLYQAQFGHPVPEQIQKADFSPQLVEQLRLGAIKAGEQTRLKLEQQRVSAYEKTQAAVRGNIAFNQNFDNIEKKAQRVAEGRAKALGEDLVPTGKDVSRIARTLVGADFTAMDPVIADAKARELVLGTQKMLKEVPGMTAAEAEKAVWKKMKETDEYLKLEEKKKNGNDVKYPMPYKEGVELRDGKFYEINGKTYQYESSVFGKGKMIEVSAESLDVGNSSEPEETETETETED